MNNVILFDGAAWNTLRPLTLTRPTSDCQVGIRTIRQKWEGYLQGNYSILTKDYLSSLFPTHWTEDNLMINGAALPNPSLIANVNNLKANQALVDHGEIIAFRYSGDQLTMDDVQSAVGNFEKIEVATDLITYPEAIINFCDQEYRKDYGSITANRTSQPIDTSVKTRGDQIFIEEGAKVYDCILNATEGPIYIGRDAEIMENAVVKGPVGIGDNCTVHVSSKIYAHTMLGPWTKIGGEVKRSTIFGYSNKAHDGYLGDSVIGKWCNMGADTNNSNMKNTYGMVSLWDMTSEKYRVTDRQFLGLIMGDHTMCAINTAFMTGSVTGVFANVFGQAPNRWTPPFSWGSAEADYNVDRAITVAERAQSRRKITTSEDYKTVLRHIANQS